MVPVELEKKFVKACEDGNVDVCRICVVDLERQSEVAAEAFQELLGYAFSCAAAHNQIDVMELLLDPEPPTDRVETISKASHDSLMHGMCRWEKYFPRRQRFECCFALRYLAYAAVVCVEQNALEALEVLIQQQRSLIPRLLVETDVVRCFYYAMERGSDFQAPAPEAYRPMLMLLLYQYPTLLLVHVDGTHDLDKSIDGVLRKRMEALRSSLLYEYVTNPQMHR